MSCLPLLPPLPPSGSQDFPCLSVSLSGCLSACCVCPVSLEVLHPSLPFPAPHIKPCSRTPNSCLLCLHLGPPVRDRMIWPNRDPADKVVWRLLGIRDFMLRATRATDLRSQRANLELAHIHVACCLTPATESLAADSLASLCVC